ncbi:hypothetical protein FKM82_029286 [Ascaphus truei]
MSKASRNRERDFYQATTLLLKTTVLRLTSSAPDGLHCIPRFKICLQDLSIVHWKDIQLRVPLCNRHKEQQHLVISQHSH